jgi:uncharacterized protein
MIPPSAWPPLVWNGGGDHPVFDNLVHANKVMGLVKEHYNAVASALFERPGDYAPIFPIDRRNGDVLWQIWIEGFDRAVKLRPAAWSPLMAADSRTAQAWRGLMNLIEVAGAELPLSSEQYDALSASALDKIAGWVLDLNDWRIISLRQSCAPKPIPSRPHPARLGATSRVPAARARNTRGAAG